MKPNAKSNRPEKRAAMSAINDLVAGSDYCFLLNYGGLAVGEFTQLRSQLSKSDSAVKVVKNIYLAKAIEAKGWEAADDLLNGPTAIVTGSGDPAEVAKVIIEFLKKSDKASAKGAWIEDSALSADDVKVLSELPPRDVMRAMLLGTMMAPATSLVRVFSAPLTGVLYVLQAKAEKDGDTGSAA